MRFVKKVANRGQVTLPSDVRDALDVEDGDIVEYEVVAVVKKRRPVRGRALPGEPEPV